MLQGSLENFALDEVLGLLSGTSKTGQLEIAGNRGTGSLMFYQGRVVDGSASYSANGNGLEDVMFELLRYDEGTFTFTQRDVTPGAGAENVASVLANAEARLRDWRSIEAVVPSLNHQVTPAADLPAEEVTVTRQEWAVLTVIASGCSVSLVCDKLDLGEVEGSRQIKNLAERQLVIVTDPIGSYSRASAMATTEVPEGFTVGASPESAFEASVPPPPPALEPVAATETVSATESLPTPDVSAEADLAVSGPALGSLMSDRPPMPPAPAADELADPFAVPPAPPSPAEIAGFSEGIEDASELVEPADEGRGGILARYLKGDD